MKIKLGYKNRMSAIFNGSVDVDSFLNGDDYVSDTRIDADKAMKYSAVLACIKVRAETFASVPALLYKRTPDGRDAVTDLPIYDLLHYQPNSEMSPFNFKETVMTNFDLYGNSVCEKLIDSKGNVVGLYPYNYQNITVERDSSTRKLIYKVKSGDSERVLKRDRVLHVPNLSYDGIIGLSPIEYASRAIRLGMSYEDFGVSFYKNAATPSGVFEHPSALSDTAFQQLRKDIASNYQGLKNSGTPMILEGGMKWHQTTINPIDAQLIESKYFQIEDICRIYRVPQHMINKLDRCMPGDTLIYTPNGPKPIKDIDVGDFVWSIDEPFIKASRVSNKWFNGERRVLEIKTTNRTVKCTENHRLLVRRQKLRPLSSGEVGGKNINGKKMRVEWENAYVMAGELKTNDVLISINRVPDNNNNVAPNGRELTIGFMEFAGLLLGDGNINKQYGRASHVSIARSNSASYMDHYREIMKSEFKSYDGGNGRGDRSLVPLKPITLTEGDRTTKFASVIAATELTELGLSGIAHIKRVPGWVYQTSEDMRLAFLRGFLDADGTVDKLGRITYYSVNKSLIDDLRHLCMGLGIPVTNTRSDVNRKPAPNSNSLVLTEMWRFTCSNPGENMRIGSHDARYVERLNSGKPFEKKNRAYPRNGGKGFDHNCLSLSKIVQIKDCGPEEVYDIEVEDSHCFVANGIISHNSTNNNIEHQSLEFVIYTMLPIFKRWEDNINMQLITPEQRKAGYYIEFKIDGLLRGDQKSRSESYATARQWGWLSVNDIRRLENMRPIENGDIYLEPLNYKEAGLQENQSITNKMINDVQNILNERGSN